MKTTKTPVRIPAVQGKSAISGYAMRRAHFIMLSVCAVFLFISSSHASVNISGTTYFCCTGSSIALTGSPTGGTWISGNTSIATVGSTSGNVTGVASGTVDITYTTGSGSAIQNITVNATPGVIYGTTYYTCTGVTLPLFDDSTGGTWSSSDPAVGTIDATSGEVTGITVGTTTITYTITYAAGSCSITRSYNVWPSAPAITGTMSVCEGATTTLSDAVTGLTWASTDMGKATVDASGNVTGVSAGNVDIYYYDAIGCGAIANVTVNPLPAAIGGPTLVCLYSGITATCTPSGGSWSSSDLSIATIDPVTGDITPVSAGIITVTYAITATGCLTTEVVDVDTYPGNISGVPDMCYGGVFTFTSDGEAGGTWSSSGAAVTVNATTGEVTGVATGPATITYTIYNGCISGPLYSTYSISIDPVPGAITGGPSTICYDHPQQAFLSDTPPGGVWSSSDPAIATVSSSGVVTGHSIGFVYIYYGFGNCLAKYVLESKHCGPRPGNAVQAEGEQGYALYPNPNNGNLYLKQNIADEKPAQVAVYNVLGQIVYDNQLQFNSGNASVNISNAPGVYMLRLTDSDGKHYMMRFTIE